MQTVLLCLHGWGGSKESFAELRAALKGSAIDILTPDLPGFGSENEPSKPFNVDDYADWVEQWLKEALIAHSSKLKALYVLGHSHGGRIAIKLATRHSLPIKHLYLCAAAGIRRPRHLKRIIGLTLAKTGKTLLSIPGIRSLRPLGKKLLYKLVRVHDYEKASPIMRQSLILTTEEDLRPLLSKIKIPTDLFWGKQDGMTPFADALIMEKEIPNSTLHAYEGVRHGVHRDKAKEIANVIRTTINV